MVLHHDHVPNVEASIPEVRNIYTSVFINRFCFLPKFKFFCVCSLFLLFIHLVLFQLVRILKPDGLLVLLPGGGSGAHHRHSARLLRGGVVQAAGDALNFCSAYYAHYRARREWMQILTQALKQVLVQWGFW